MLHSSRRSKGNSFEYDCEYSLKVIYPDIEALERRGMPMGFDLISKQHRTVFECKNHQGVTWNELIKYWVHIGERAENISEHYLIFKTNRQPVLVMSADKTGICIRPFKDVFLVEFKNRPKGYSKSETEKQPEVLK